MNRHDPPAPDSRSKLRILAQLKRLQQDSAFLEEELGQLEGMETALVVCKDLQKTVEAKPDPLLPVTNGPVNQSWDRWFQGPQEPKRCSCWIW